MDMSGSRIASNQQKDRKLLVARIHIKRKIDDKLVEKGVPDRTVVSCGGFYNRHLLAKKAFQKAV